MGKVVHIEVVSKTPPGGRCEFYDRTFFYLVKTSKNLYYTLIPENLYSGNVKGPAVLINGREVVPEDGVLLTGDELFKALKESGVDFKEDEEKVRNRLEQEYKKFVGGV